MINVTCCVILIIIVVIFWYRACNCGKNKFYPERVPSICEEAKRTRQIPCDPVARKCAANYNYNLGNSLNARINTDGAECKIDDMDFVVNPLTMSQSFSPLRYMFKNQQFALWPLDRGYMTVDTDYNPTYDPSCVNVGLPKTSCKVDDRVPYVGPPITDLGLGDCMNNGIKEKIKESFVSERHNEFEKRFYGGQGFLGDGDPRFPKQIPGAPSSDAEYTGVLSAGGPFDIGFLPTRIGDGKLSTEYVEIDERLKKYDHDHGITDCSPELA